MDAAAHDACTPFDGRGVDGQGRCRGGLKDGGGTEDGAVEEDERSDAERYVEAERRCSRSSRRGDRRRNGRARRRCRGLLLSAFMGGQWVGGRSSPPLNVAAREGSWGSRNSPVPYFCRKEEESGSLLPPDPAATSPTWMLGRLGALALLCKSLTLGTDALGICLVMSIIFASPMLGNSLSLITRTLSAHDGLQPISAIPILCGNSHLRSRSIEPVLQPRHPPARHRYISLRLTRNPKDFRPWRTQLQQPASKAPPGSSSSCIR